MGKGGGAPDAPDPFETAQSVFQYNNLTTQNPDGSGVEFGYLGPNGQFVQGIPGQGQSGARRIIESQNQRQMRENSERAFLNLQNSVVGPGAGPLQQVSDVDAIAGEMYDRHLPHVTRFFDRDRMRTEGRLQDRGLPIGSAAYADGMQPVLDSQNYAVTDLARRSYDAAGAEQSRRQGLRSQQIGERMGLIDGRSSFTPSNITQASQATPIDIGGFIQDNYNSQLQAYNTAQNRRQQTLGGVLGGIFGLLSDRDRKHDYGLQHGLLKAAKRAPVHRWRYDHTVPHDQNEHIGPMAQDFQQAFGVGDGKSISLIDYMGVMFGMIQELSQKIEDLEAKA